MVEQSRARWKITPAAGKAAGLIVQSELVRRTYGVDSAEFVASRTLMLVPYLGLSKEERFLADRKAQLELTKQLREAKEKR